MVSIFRDEIQVEQETSVKAGGKMEAICSSETSEHFKRTTRGYASEDGILHNHGCQNLKCFYAMCVVW
jgi:hypothetical protein